MYKIKKLLVVVDMQNDFIDGPLGTNEAKSIVNNVVDKIKECQEKNYPIVFTLDTHLDDFYLKSKEGKNLPIKHCIAGTEGHQLNNEIFLSLNEHNYINYTQTPMSTIYKKTFAPTSEEVLNCWFLRKAKEENYYFEEIEIIGVCTDICVISTAVQLTSMFHEQVDTISVNSSCCAGTTPEKHQKALDIMESLHIKIK